MFSILLHWFPVISTEAVSRCSIMKQAISSSVCLDHVPRHCIVLPNCQAEDLQTHTWCFLFPSMPPAWEMAAGVAVLGSCWAFSLCVSPPLPALPWECSSVGFRDVLPSSAEVISFVGNYYDQVHSHKFLKILFYFLNFIHVYGELGLFTHTHYLLSSPFSSSNTLLMNFLLLWSASVCK